MISEDNSSEIEQVIRSTFKRGDGSSANPNRIVTTYRRLNGELLVEQDPESGITYGEQLRAPFAGVLAVGDRRMLTLHVLARVTEVQGVGIGASARVGCYELELERRDYNGGRTVSVDVDEILDVELVDGKVQP